MGNNETLSQARLWEKVKSLYVRDGLCDGCASQAAYGHQLGFGYVSPRDKWSEADRRIKPPCSECAPIVAAFPVDVPRSQWRRWRQGDRRPVPAALVSF